MCMPLPRRTARRQRAQPAKSKRLELTRVFGDLASRSTSGAAPAAPLPRSLKKDTLSRPSSKLQPKNAQVRDALFQRANTAKRSQQNDGRPRELTRDHRRPPGADRLHERAAYRGTSLLHLQLPFPTRAVRARRAAEAGCPHRRAGPAPCTPPPARQYTLSRAPRPSRPRTRPQI